jgi:hypothetical protein
MSRPPPRNPPPGASSSSRTTRQQTTQAAQLIRSESEGSDDGQPAQGGVPGTAGLNTDIVRLQNELDLAHAEITQLRNRPEYSVPPDQPLPTTETPPVRPRTQTRAFSEAFDADMARYI